MYVGDMCEENKSIDDDTSIRLQNYNPLYILSFLFKNKLFIFNTLHYLKEIQKVFKYSYSVVQQSLVALIICAVGDLCAGLILGHMTLFSSLAWIINPYSGSYWNEREYFGAFGSRLGTDLNIGMLSLN